MTMLAARQGRIQDFQIGGGGGEAQKNIVLCGRGPDSGRSTILFEAIKRKIRKSC